MLEYMLLKYGLMYAPASINIIAKRIGITETEKNLEVLKKELDKMILRKKAYRSGNRYAIDAEGAKSISKYLDDEIPETQPNPTNFKKVFKQQFPVR